MSYPMQSVNKPGNMLTAEEYDVLQSLRDYTDDPDKAGMNDFVPTRKLYQTYRDWHAQHCSALDPEATSPLTKSQFGSALKRVFPHLADEWDSELQNWDTRRVRRRVNGKLVWGYCCLKGPESVQTQDYVGRPKADPDDDGR